MRCSASIAVHKRLVEKRASCLRILHAAEMAGFECQFVTGR